MRRNVIALMLTAALLCVSAAAPPRAQAVVPVFDPANFAKLVALLVKEDVITQQNAAKLVYDYQIATEAYNNGHLNYDMVYQQAVPMLDGIDKQLSADTFMQQLAARMMAQFKGQYGQWDPVYDYSDILGALNSGMQAEMGQIVSNARDNAATVTARSRQMDAMTAQLAHSKGAVDSLAVIGEELQVLQGTQAQIHTQLVNMLQAMSTYYSYELQKDKAAAQNVGDQMLLQQFGKIPGQAANQQPQTQARPVIVGTPHPY